MAAKLRYILQFKIENIEMENGKMNSILNKVIIVPSTQDIGLDTTMSKERFTKKLKTKNKSDLVNYTYYFIPPDDFKDIVCATDIINNTSNIEGNYSDGNIDESVENIVVVPIDYSSGKVSPTITILDDTSVNVGGKIYNLEDDGIKPQLGGKPKGGRTKRRKYRKKRKSKSKSSRKSRRKTAKK